MDGYRRHSVTAIRKAYMMGSLLFCISGPTSVESLVFNTCG